MGLILDTSTIVKAERRGHSVPEMLTNVREACGETEIGLSVVTIAELTHGVYRAKLETQRRFEVATENVRHFEKIPGLIVRQL